MTHVLSRTSIRRSALQIFSFVTTPANWNQWYAATGSLDGVVDHPLSFGDTFTEDLFLVGRMRRISWTVVTCEPPRCWTINGEIERLGNVAINYELTPRPAGTMVELDIGYKVPNPVYALIDHLFIRRRMRAGSNQALDQLREVLEASHFWELDDSRHPEKFSTAC